MVRRKRELLAALQSLGQVLAVCHCTWKESPEEGFLHWVWEGGGGDLVPDGLGRPDIPELFSGGCQKCLCLRALLPTLCSCLQDGVTSWSHRSCSEVFKVTRAPSLWPPELTGQSEPTDFALPSECLLAKFRCPALPPTHTKAAHAQEFATS